MKLLVFALIWGIATTAHAKRIQIGGGEATELRTIKTASTGNDLRKARRVGVGASAMGPLGVGGVNLELNFTKQSGMIIGFGGGSGFQSYNFQWKSVLAGEWILPYMGFGVARWVSYGQQEPIKETAPPVLGERFLTQNDKEEGRIQETLLYPVVGIQYMQLSGEWAGFSLYAEVLLLVDTDEFASGPTGTLGAMYYF